MFKFLKPPALPPQLIWEYAHEPELMGWTIQARDYNTQIANIMFAFMAMMVLGLSIYLYSQYGIFSQPWRTIWCVLFFTIISLAILGMTHQRKKFAYRLTKSGIEHCEWKEFPEWMLTGLKWFAGIVMIICIGLAVSDPRFAIGALVGPGAMGLVYFSMANSKSFREMQTEYHHYFLKWEELTQLAIASNRELVDVKYCVIDEDSPYPIKWNLNIYCRRHEKNKVAEFIKPHLSPGVPCIVAKVNVPLSTV